MRRLFPALQHSGFVRLWLASGISTIGSLMTFIALPLLAWHLTGSASAFGSVFAAEGIGTLVAGLAGGVFADRFDRRRMMLTGDGFALLLVLSLVPITAHGWWAPIPFVAFLMQLSAVTFSASGPALKRSLLPEEHFRSGTALEQLSGQAANLVAPLVGAALYQGAGMRPILVIDALTYIVSIALVGGLRGVQTRPARDTSLPRSLGPALRLFHTDVAEALQLVRGDTVLRRLLLGSFWFSIGNGALFVAILPWITNDLHASPSMFGVFVSCLGGPGIVAALVLARIGDRFEPTTLLRAAAVPAIIGAGILPIASVGTLIGCGLIFGVVDVVINVALTTIFQRRIVSAMQGRVGSLFMLTFQLPRTIGLIAFGPMVDAWGPRSVIAIWSVGVIVGIVMEQRVVAALRREQSPVTSELALPVPARVLA